MRSRKEFFMYALNYLHYILQVGGQNWIRGLCRVKEYIFSDMVSDRGINDINRFHFHSFTHVGDLLHSLYNYIILNKSNWDSILTKPHKGSNSQKQRKYHFL